MQEYPFTLSGRDRGLAFLTGGAAIAIQCALLAYYTSIPLAAALADSLLSVLFLGAAAYVYGFVMNYLRMFRILALLAVCVQAIGIGLTFIGVYAMGLEDWGHFAPTIPLRFLIGLLVWAILSQAYERLAQSDESSEISAFLPTPPDPVALSPEIPPSPSAPSDRPSSPPDPLSYPDRLPYPDRLSVKDGSRIHIIPLEEILYLQACGDYVTVVTASGQYVKEQTMKYFEAHLPPTRFIRIHRSYIVNAAQILRVELFGKENYHIRLHNGVILRASLTGYKLLKARLSL